MILLDVNVIVLAFRRDQPDHEAVRHWLEAEVNSGTLIALADSVVAGFIRIVTNPRIYIRPSQLATAIEFLDGLASRENCVQVAAGPRHWEILRRLLVDSDARANLVPDAHLAAVALEHGASVATRDHGFSRFRAVRFLDPIAAETLPAT